MLFISKFCFLLCSFLSIKKKLLYKWSDQKTKLYSKSVLPNIHLLEINDWGKLSPIAEFIFNITINASTSHTPFKLNCGYYSSILFEDKTDSCSRSCFANKLTKKLRELVEICYYNLLYTTIEEGLQ